MQYPSQFPDPKWYFGLDLGQRQDHSALAALELTWTAAGRCLVTYEFRYEPWLHIRQLQRFPIGLPYERLYGLIHDSVRQINPGYAVAQELVIDAGGPGIPVVERLRASFGANVNIKPILITGGKTASALSGGFTGVPRRNLVSTIQLLLAARSLKCRKDLEGMEILEDELLELARQDSQPTASRAHDDIAIASGLAAWAAVRDVPELLPESEETRAKRRPRSIFGTVRLL